MKKQIVVYVLLLLFLIAVVFMVANLSAGRTTFFGKATNVGVFSSANSYIFASPLSARAGGDRIRVTVFVLDGTGKGVPGKNVSVLCKSGCQEGEVIIGPIQPATDGLGQAIFDVSASTAGRFEFQASVEGVSVPQTVTVIFL